MSIGYTPMARIFFLDQKMRDNKYPNSRDVIEKFGVKRRTVLRDIDYMRDQLLAPVEYCHKNRGYYYIEKTYYLPTVYLTLNHAVSLKMIEEIIKQYHSVPYVKELEGILKNLFQYSPNLSFDSPMSFMQRPLPQVNVKIIEGMQKAIIEKNCVEITHYSAEKDKTTVRKVAGYHILNHYGIYYLVGRCYMRKAVRIFAIHRIVSARVLSEKFKHDEKFSLSEYLNESFDLRRDDSKEYKVKLKFSPYQARYIKERVWHPTQTMKENKDGSVVLSFSVKGLSDVKSWVLYHGSEVEVLQPKELRKEVIAEYEKVQKLYKL